MGYSNSPPCAPPAVSSEAWEVARQQMIHLDHLNARDTTLAFVSRAPQADITRLKARMGWDMPWYK